MLPPDAPSTVTDVVVELRDVTYADARAPILATVTLPEVAVHASARIPFELIAPEGSASQQLSVECRIAVTGGPTVAAGDLLTTQSVAVPPEGDVTALEVPVTLL